MKNTLISKKNQFFIFIYPELAFYIIFLSFIYNYTMESGTLLEKYRFARCNAVELSKYNKQDLLILDKNKMKLFKHGEKLSPDKFPSNFFNKFTTIQLNWIDKKNGLNYFSVHQLMALNLHKLKALEVRITNTDLKKSIFNYIESTIDNVHSVDDLLKRLHLMSKVNNDFNYTKNSFYDLRPHGSIQQYLDYHEKKFYFKHNKMLIFSTIVLFLLLIPKLKENNFYAQHYKYILSIDSCVVLIAFLYRLYRNNIMKKLLKKITFCKK